MGSRKSCRWGPGRQAFSRPRLRPRRATGGEGAHAADESGNPLGGLSILIPPALRPWVLVLLGTNEALAPIRGTIPDLFTSGDGQQGPVELLSRAYQAVVRTIDEAIPFLASQGDPISLAALPVPAVAWGIDEVASDLALESPSNPKQLLPRPQRADDVRHLGEVLARPTKSWRVGLVGGFITGSTVIAANAVRKGLPATPAPKESVRCRRSSAGASRGQGRFSVFQPRMDAHRKIQADSERDIP